MTKHRRLCQRVWWLFGLECAALSNLAHAQESIQASSDARESVRNRAEAAFWEGKRHYESGAFEQALKEFETAYRLVGDPDLLYDIAQTLRQMGDCSLARESYEQFARISPNSPRASLANKQVALLRTSCAPASVGPAPASAAVLAAPIPRQSSSARPSTAKVRAIVGPTQPPTQDRVTERRLSHWAIASLVAGLAVGSVAVGLGLWNEGRYNLWQERDSALDKGNARGESPQQWLARQNDNDALIHSIRVTDYATVGLGIGAGVLLIIPSVLYLTSGTAQSRAEPQSEKGPGLKLLPAAIGSTGAAITVHCQF